MHALIEFQEWRLIKNYYLIFFNQLSMAVKVQNRNIRIWNVAFIDFILFFLSSINTDIIFRYVI